MNTRNLLSIALLTVVGVSIAQSIESHAAGPQVGGIANSRSSIVTVESVMLAADRIRADRWYPATASLGQSQAEIFNRFTDMEMLLFAASSPFEDLRRTAVREFGRFETAENVNFIIPFLDDAFPSIRMEAANALVQTLIGESAPTMNQPQPTTRSPTLRAIVALNERMIREQDAQVIPALWNALAELPINAQMAVRLERLFIDQIRQQSPTRIPAGHALVRLLRNARGRRVEAATERALREWARIGVTRGTLTVEIGPIFIGTTLTFLNALQAIRADDDNLAIGAAGFQCLVAVPSVLPCGWQIRLKGVELLNPHNPDHHRALLRAAQFRDDLPARAAAIRKLITAPDMALCDLLELARGSDAEADVVAALEEAKPDRYATCVDWSPEEYLKKTAGTLATVSKLGEWIVPARALEALAKRHPGDAKTIANETAMRHDRWQVRAAAARVAGIVGDAELAATLADDRDHNVRADALMALLTMSSPALWPNAIEALKSSDLHLIRTAARTLDSTPDRAVAVTALLETLERLTKDEKDTSRRARLAILERLPALIRPETDPEFPLWRNEIQKYLTDVEPNVAESAADAIEVMTKARPEPRPTRRPASQPTEDEIRGLQPCLVLQVDSLGELAVRVNREEAAVALARVVALVRSGYYDGLTFHRRDENLAIGGNPAANDEGGIPRFIRDEVGSAVSEYSFVLLGHGRDTNDGRFAFRLQARPELDRRETVLGRFIPQANKPQPERIFDGAVVSTIRERTSANKDDPCFDPPRRRSPLSESR